MSSGSLRLRLIAAAAAAVALALALSGVVLSRLFMQHVETRVYAELINHLNQIIANVEVSADGSVVLVAPPADPRFFTPASGLYWQLDLPGGIRQRSRSLWEDDLALPVDDLDNGAIHRHEIAGPRQARLVVAERGITVGPQQSSMSVRLAVAIDRREIDEATADFRGVLARSLAVVGIVLLAALWAMIQFGLLPMVKLGEALQSVHAGKRSRVEGRFPSEVQPLIRDMNALLDKERQANVRARERASDLAHGFKTPLAILAAVARDLQREGQDRSAAEIDTQIDIMGRHVTRELARTRVVGAATVGQTAIAVRPVFDKVVTALKRISNERHLNWSIDAPDAASFAGDENDLLELVGNICDNAAKWARSRIEVHICEHHGRLLISIADDGPGIPAGSEAEVLARGSRLDQATGGTGLGLSIVAKVVDAYGGTIQLTRSVLGGLLVEISLPTVAHAA